MATVYLARDLKTLEAPAALIAAIPLWIATIFAGTRSVYHYTVGGRRRELETLADRLAELARQLAPAPLPPAPERARLP